MVCCKTWNCSPTIFEQKGRAMFCRRIYLCWATFYHIQMGVSIVMGVPQKLDGWFHGKSPSRNGWCTHLWRNTVKRFQYEPYYTPTLWCPEIQCPSETCAFGHADRESLDQCAMAVGNPAKARLNIGQRFLQTPEARHPNHGEVSIQMGDPQARWMVYTFFHGSSY